MPLFEIGFALILAYLIGSISSAIIVCNIMQLPDPRSQGSNNPGATNVLRIGGKLPAALTLLGDLLKGFLPVFIAKQVGFPHIGLALVMFAAFIGHLYPIYFHFKGGKGVATLIGCLLALSFPIGICWMLTWLVVAGVFRYVSLASMMASIMTPLYAWYITGDLIFVATLMIMGLIVVYRHQTNIVKLIKGSENKIRSR